MTSCRPRVSLVGFLSSANRFPRGLSGSSAPAPRTAAGKRGGSSPGRRSLGRGTAAWSRADGGPRRWGSRKIYLKNYKKNYEFGGFGPGNKLLRRCGGIPSKNRRNRCLGGDFLGQNKNFKIPDFFKKPPTLCSRGVQN